MLKDASSTYIYMRPQTVVLTGTVSNWLIISFSQRTVDHGLPARFNCARSPDPSVNHFLGWLPHRCDGGVGQSER